MRVEDRDVTARGTVLDACRAAGIDVAAFCHDPRSGLRAGAHCRSCIVEADGRHVAACATPAEGVDVVRTDTPALRDYRRHLGALMLLEAEPGGHVGDTLRAWGAERPAPSRGRASDRTHPVLRIDLSACILCRRCERACAGVQGQFVLGTVGRGGRTELAWGADAFVDSGCVACGACVDACPTGAITDRDRAAPREVPPREVAPPARTTCGYCGVGCQLDVSVKGEGSEARIARVSGTPGAAVNDGHACAKGRYGHGFVRHPDRLRAPLVRTDGRLVEATWEAAIARVAAGLRGREVLGLSSARATNEENYLFQKWMRAGLGTNDVDCCARVCHAPSAAGMRAVLGTGASTNGFDDVAHADLLLVVGANVTEAHPVLGARVRQAVLRGARLIVVDPRRTELAALADVHLQLRPGTNLPLLEALACVLVRDGSVDEAFLAARVDGWEGLRDAVRHQTPERWAPVTGVPAEQVRAAARLFGAARAPMLLHGLGVTEHVHGTEGVELLCALALMRGAVGRPGTGVNPLRGQNNVQGAVDMGADPAFLPGYQPVSDEAARARVEAVWGRRIPSLAGRTLPQMLDLMRERRQGVAAVVFGEDLVRTEPSPDRVRDALGGVGFLCVIELFLSETAQLADVVLPGASWLEKDGTFTNAERRVQRVRATLPPVAGRTDFDVLLALMEAGGYPQALRSVAEVQDEIARVAPLYAGLVRAAARSDDGAQWPLHADGTGTPLLHAGRFATPNGRARLRPIAPAVPEALVARASADQLLLTTGRTLHAYNAGAMTRRGAHAEPPALDPLELHPDDAARRGIVDGQDVRVLSAHGEAQARARVTDRVRAGTAFLSFHAPASRTNHLVGPASDGATGCPAYKITRVRALPRRSTVSYCVPFEQLGIEDLSRVGGKNAATGELMRALAPATGVRVPSGFAVTVDAYDAVLAQGDTRDRLGALLAGLRPDDVADLTRRADEARAIVRAAGLPGPVADAIRAACAAAFPSDAPVAVRSSATAEDLPEASFAGQQESFLNLVGVDAILDACLRCMASLFTARALAYRHGQGIGPLDARLSVGVQRLVRADHGAAGVLFTIDPESGSRGAIVINGAWGLGESVVGGRVAPDEWVVASATLGLAPRPIVRRRLGAKRTRVVADDAGTRTEPTPADLQARFCLSDDAVLELARQGAAIGRAWSTRAGRPVPMDVEWAHDGTDLWILQARPETVHAQRTMLERWVLEGRGDVLLRGQSVGQRIGAGAVRIVRSVETLSSVQAGEVLVTEMTDPDWVPVMRRAAAIVTDGGGRTCHAAIVSRELGVPCVVGTGDATSRLRDGQLVTVDGSGGDEGRVLAGQVAFRRDTVDPSVLPRPETRVLLNLADPDRAFALARLPVDGVGLARQEFIVAERIGVHPCAVLFPERVDAAARAELAVRARGHADPVDWYVSVLAEGLGTIAAAFYPRQVIARFSDFKSNEYARLIGGAAFEPREENPMIGWRGASRYTDPRFRAAFALECRAVRRVREDMGLTNLEVMVPFCRTVDEARRVLRAMAEEGLERVPDGPRVHVMCEVPSNVAAIDLFAEVFDGFSIGSNDLTQLVLGVDRDSREVSGLFREDDPAVRRTISAAIRGAHAAGRPIGICGQAPSDDPAFAAFLVREGIDSVSLDPASVLDILPVLADAERVGELA